MVSLSPLRLAAWLVFAAALLVGAAAAAAQSSATQRVSLVVPEVRHLATSAGPVTLTFETPPPGEPFADVRGPSATVALTTNRMGDKVTAVLDGDVGAAAHLSVHLAPPTEAASLGMLELGTTARTLVADASTGDAAGLSLIYTASFGPEALPSRLALTRTVTYTLADQ